MESPLDLLLMMGLGFLGSFGHCAGMCGPLAIAFSISQSGGFYAQILLNLGRVLSYTISGAIIAAVGSGLVASGQFAGIDSELRQIMAWITGSLLIYLGLNHVAPSLLPRLPLFHPLASGGLHTQLNQRLSMTKSRWWTPALAGLIWGLIPCGFLYTAQVKAIATGEVWTGALTMLAFGLGTLPTMVTVGLSAHAIAPDRRQQLFRLGGWLTLLIGILTLGRTGDMTSDITGYIALLCLILALIARPISRLWSGPLRYRRSIGLGAWLFAIIHTCHILEHTWGWQWRAVRFMLRQHQWGIALGGVSLALMLPLAVTSFDQAMRKLGARWRQLHLLSIPALIAAGLHCLLTGSNFLGRVNPGLIGWTLSALLMIVIVGVLLLRQSMVWYLLSLQRWYCPSDKSPRA